MIIVFTQHCYIYAQKIPNWQNKDLQTDSVFGISADKAYVQLLKGKKSKPVIVAVIDGGIDTLHDDLVSVLWHNPHKKRFDNGTFGWSYIGSDHGSVRYDNLELTRQVRMHQSKDTSVLTADELNRYHALKQELERKLGNGKRQIQGLQSFISVLNGMLKKMGKETPSLADVQAYDPESPAEAQVIRMLTRALSEKNDFLSFKEEQLDKPMKEFEALVSCQLNTAFDPRAEFVGDNYNNSSERFYGTPDNDGPDPTHGTHVAGIIGAVRNNGIGINGVADNVRLLSIRAVPDGDERDKDIANAIIYAADHGARIINMSFGKPYSYDKKVVDDAVRYGLSKDVLFIQAAGNDNKNIDLATNFPNRKFTDGKVAGSWIVVGASGPKDDLNLKGAFSNYGKDAVDVFAPGVQIYSSIPGSKYAYFDGTSMAAPVVSGLAALIWEYYPRLSAAQVKNIILKSVVRVGHPVNLVTENGIRRVSFNELCVTGGIINAFQALELAATFK